MSSERYQKMIQLMMERYELTYEGAFAKPRYYLLDSPGKLCDLLLNALAAFGCTGSDLVVDEGEPADRAVTCEVGELDTRVTLRGNRLEVHCAPFDSRSAADVGEALKEVWSGLVRLDGDTVPKTHSFLFEADVEIRGLLYQDVLGRLAPAPESFPDWTESAVVYYLPAEPSMGHGESSLVLNRSAEVEGGLQISATLVYEAQSMGVTTALSAAQSRLSELLQNLGVQWDQD